MSNHVGGEAVQGGIYWSRRQWELVTVAAEGGRLPGTPRDQYIKCPLILALIASPILGTIFAIFLSISGVLVLLTSLVDRIRGTSSTQ